ncbi:hypothetical protein JCM8547_004654 [Rhodosporidiobolus lusitaniae]
MKRFTQRRKSRSKGKGRDDSPSSPSAESGAMARSASGSLLPELTDFRTSLILPQMMKRFSLLRGADGQLVDLKTMEDHLAHQTANGRLTTYEVDAILSQYKLQSAYESNEPAPSLPKRKRIDWSKVQPQIDEESETGSTFRDGGGFDSMRTSFATTSGEDHTSHSSHSMGRTGSQHSQRNANLSPTAAFSPTTSSAPFSPSAFSPSPNGSVASFSPSGSPNPSNAGSSTAYPYEYRRGKNSMFGGRTIDARGAKMLKSGSAQSIASLSGSVKSERRAASEEQQEDGTEDAKPETISSGEKSQKNAGEGEERSPEQPNDAFADADELAASPSSPIELPSPSTSMTPSASASTLATPQLSTKQLRRISTALDNIELELSKTYAKLASSALAEDEDEEDGEKAAEEMLRRFEEEDEREERESLKGEEEEIDDEQVVEAEEVSEVDQELEREEDERAEAGGGEEAEEREVQEEPPSASPPSSKEHLQLDTTLKSHPSIDFSSPISPVSPVNAADLAGLGTFDIPSPTLLDDSPTTNTFISPPSPTASDTEPVDPFYARLHERAAKVPLPPSIASSSPQLPISATASPVVSNSTSSPRIVSSYYSPALGGESPPPSPKPPVPSLPHSPSDTSKLDLRATSPIPALPLLSDARSAAPSPTPSTLASLAIPPRPARLRELTVETDDSQTATPGGSSPATPAAYSFPFVPSRTDSGVTARPETGATLMVAEDDEREEEDVMKETEAREEQEEMKEESSEVLEALSSPVTEAEGERTMTDEGPFDLSLGKIRLPSQQDGEDEEEEPLPSHGEDFPSQQDEEDEGEEQAEEQVEARDRTESGSSVLSHGSSFHGEDAAVERDEELVHSSAPSISTLLDIARPHSLPTHIVPPDTSSAGDSSPSLLRPMSVPLDRRPSNELLQVVAAACRAESGEGSSMGDTDSSDLILEDLLAIQDSLVRAAARRAARLASNDSSEGGAPFATPSSIASSSMAEPFNLTSLAAFARTPALDPDSSSPATAARKGSTEGSVPPSVPDLGAELAGLGLTSLAPFDLSPPVASTSQRQSRRTSASGRRDSRRTSEARRKSGGGGRRWSVEEDQRDSALLGPASSRMTAQTSQTSSTSPATNAAVTPSTNQSDAFEFSSLVASPETQSWEDGQEEQQEELREDSLASDSPYFEPPPPNDSPSETYEEGEDEDAGVDVAQEGQEAEQDQAHEEELDAVGDVELESTVVSPSLGAPAPIDTESFLRVPRNKPRRDPSTTTSMLVRDVRNQATLATIALKKQGGPTSPPMKPLVKNKSIRKQSISSPQLVSGPIAIPAVPIIKGGQSPAEGSRSPKMGRSKSRKDKDGGDDGKKGLGLRFKMLLKKPSSRDQLGQLNGDEVTPFVDFDMAAAEASQSASAPITPPNQAVARFDSSSPSDFPQTPNDTLTPEHSRSPIYSAPSQGLAVVDEAAERASPAPSIASGSPSLGFSPSSASTNSRSLSRIMSRIRSGGGSVNGRRGSNASSLQQENLRNSAASPERPTSPLQSPRNRPYSPPAVTGSRRPSLDQEVVELGFGGTEEHGGRAPASYKVGSPRVRQRPNDDTFETTAPLSPSKHYDGGSNYSFPPDSSASGRISKDAPRASIDSMRKLWQAAEDLGLPPDKVQELVDSAYAQSPTTSSHHHSGSTSTVGRGSSGGSGGHRRGPSEASAASPRRGPGSISSRKSVHDRVPTPPPAGRHHRQASVTSSRNAGPVPDLPSSYSSPAGDNNRLSVYSTTPSGNLAVPHSPSLGSIGSGSEYANSFLDFYTGGDDGEEEEGEQVFAGYDAPPPLPGRRPSLAPSIDEQLAQQRQQYEDDQQQHTVRLNPIGESEERPDYRQTLQATLSTPDPSRSDEVVWSVLNDLRSHRLSTLSKDSSFGFDSRHSSFEGERTRNSAGSGDQAEAIANLLRHRDRNGSTSHEQPSQARPVPPDRIPPWEKGRYPSIFMRDEDRLLALGEQGGIAPDQEGRFLVRPVEAVPDMPELPEEFRGQSRSWRS